jgi:hypothetical protein
MDRIKINTVETYILAQKLKDSNDAFVRLLQDVYRPYKQLDLEIRSKSKIDGMINEAIRYDLGRKIYQLGKYVEKVTTRFIEVDRQCSNSLTHIAIRYNLNPYNCNPTLIPGHGLDPAHRWKVERPGVGTDPHTGIDIFGGLGDPINSVHSGTVIRIYDKDIDKASKYGYAIKIETEIDSDKYVFVYAHLKDKPELKEGQWINIGDQIGLVGNTGAEASDPHLHFEVRKNGVKINPEDFLEEMQKKSVEWYPEGAVEKNMSEQF